MLAVLPFLAVSLLLAALVASRRRTATSTTNRPSPRALDLVRTGRVGEIEAVRPVRASIHVAPDPDPGSALRVVAPDGTVARDLAVQNVAMARGWSGGRLRLSFGEPHATLRAAWPLGPNIAGWEIHVLDTSGNVLRCYGRPGSVLDEELARLQERLQRPALASAG